MRCRNMPHAGACLSYDLVVCHGQQPASVVEVCLQYSVLSIIEFIMQRIQIEERPADAIIKARAGVAGPGDRHLAVQPYPDCKAFRVRPSNAAFQSGRVSLVAMHSWTVHQKSLCLFALHAQKRAFKAARPGMVMSIEAAA